MTYLLIFVAALAVIFILWLVLATVYLFKNAFGAIHPNRVILFPVMLLIKLSEVFNKRGK